MFNVSLKLRSQQGFETPVGPYLPSTPTSVLNIEGVEVFMRFPKHRTSLPTKPFAINSPCRLKDISLRLYEENGIGLYSAGVLLRTWDFYGPWFTGSMGGVVFHAYVSTPKNRTQGLNYFHPRALEVGIADCLKNEYGGEFSSIDGSQLWNGPFDWKQQEGAACVAARFKVVRKSGPHIGPHYFMVFPLSKIHLMIFSCKIDRPGVFPIDDPKLTADDWIDLKPFTTLANQVLDSVQIKLSPEAEAAQQEALQGLSEADRQLVKDFPPLKWTKEKSDLIQAS